MDGIIRTDTGISSLDNVSISTVATPSSRYEAVVVPKDASATPCVATGRIHSSAAISAETNER